MVKQAKNTVPIADSNKAGKILKLMENLEEHDDVQRVFANFDIPDEVLEKVGRV